MRPSMVSCLLCLVALFLPGVPAYTQAITFPPANYDPVFDAPPKNIPVARTPDAPLAGNGDIGIVLGGIPDSLTFYIGKNDFWRAYPVYPGGGIALPGGLNLVLPALRGASYHARESLADASIDTDLEKDSLRLSLHSWVTESRNTVVIECRSSRPLEMRLQLWATTGNTSIDSSGHTHVAGQANYISWVTRSFVNTPLLAWPCHIAIAMNILGADLAADGVLRLLPGHPVSITLTAYTSFDKKDFLSSAVREAAGMTPGTLAALRSEHNHWWRRFWQASDVHIPDSFLMKYYYASQYLFASASRKNKFAPGIWGPFITRDSMAWGGDYHLNYNYQAPYWAAYSSNHIDCTDNYDQPLLDYMPEGKRLSRLLLHLPGIYYPVGIGPHGLVTARWPLTPEEMQQRYGTTENTIDSGYKFLGQKINAVFGAANMLMRFYSTYDSSYARRVYPYLLACADFWEHYLSFEDNRYVIRMDHFNEVMPNLRTNGQWRNRLGDFNSTLSLGLVTMLFRGITDMSLFLDRDHSRRPQWRFILQHLSSFPVGEKDGRQSLKNMEKAPNDVVVPPAGLNRVSIHGLLMPGGITGPYTDSAFDHILVNDIAHWSDRMAGPGEWGNTLGNGIETCFPGAVRAGYDPDTILQQLKARIVRQSFTNGWIPQAGGGVETLAAVPLTINEMLLQSYEGILRVFPNFPHSWDASFHHLRAYGAFLVSSRLTKGKIEFILLQSEKGRPCRLQNPWPGQKVRLHRKGQPDQILAGRRLLFNTAPGEEIRLSPAP